MLLKLQNLLHFPDFQADLHTAHADHNDVFNHLVSIGKLSCKTVYRHNTSMQPHDSPDIRRRSRNLNHPGLYPDRLHILQWDSEINAIQ